MPRTVKVNAASCGICGNPLDDCHGVDGHSGDGGVTGKRVEYVVVGKRGGIADFRETDGDSKVRRTDAATLAFELGVDESALPGCRFSCWVERAEYGVIRSNFTLSVK
uniref:hypothetical protein n=1 Tax=Paractinoplanes polyasparticus TaxID=2856853 RepID=UPI001C857887|nr:hypothetical protein [Actinoplanes polyasparticus]